MTRQTSLLTTEFDRLEDWCAKVRRMLHEQPYLVGSALDRRDYRDVDIRVMFADERFDAEFAIRGGGSFDPVRVRYLNHALSVWGQRETGLPIDFQVQRTTEANAEYSGIRNPMGMRDWQTVPTSGVPAHSGSAGGATKPEGLDLAYQRGWRDGHAAALGFTREARSAGGATKP